MLTKELVEFGLGEKEAIAYLKLLELEVASVQEIAKAANLNRSSTYVVLESLKNRGLVSISDDKKVRKYVATPPEALLRAAQDQANHQQNILKKIEAVVPDMKALYRGTKKKPLVKIFEGREGVIACLEATLGNKEKQMRVISSPKNLGNTVGKYIIEYLKKRVELNILLKGIHPDTPENRNLMKITPSKDIDDSVLVPVNKYEFQADLAIYDNKIEYVSPKDGGIAISIESKEMSDVMKNLFDLAFEEAKRLNKGIKDKSKTK